MHSWNKIRNKNSISYLVNVGGSIVNFEVEIMIAQLTICYLFQKFVSSRFLRKIIIPTLHKSILDIKI